MADNNDKHAEMTADGDNLNNHLGSATEPDETSNDSSTVEDLLTMELPPVSEVDNSYHEAEPEPEQEATTTASPDSPGQNQDTTQAAERLRGVKDDKGAAYDPSIHEYPPEKTPTGKWKKIPKAKQQEKDPETQAENSNNSIRLEAQKAAQIYAGFHMGLFGAENGRASSKEQFMMLVDSFENYMLENGVKRLPAGADLMMTMGLYTADVSFRPSNTQKIKGWFSGAFSWFKNRKDKKKNKPVETPPKTEEKAPNA